MLTATQSAASATFNRIEVGATGAFMLHFASLFQAGREFAFPCDEQGRVNLDHMNARIRNNYLYARAMLGREFAWPTVRCVDAQGCSSTASAAF